MRENKFLIAIILSMISFNLMADAPPDSGVRKLAIFAANDGNQVNIYANDRMQAKVDVVYELEDGYKLENIELKKYITEDNLYDWKVDINSNEYRHDIMSTKNDIYSIEKLTQDRTGSSETKYLRTAVPQTIRICAVLTAIKNSIESKKSTCDGGSINSDVAISAYAAISYTLDDFIISYDSAKGLIKKEKVEYGWESIELRPRSNFILQKIVTSEGLEPYNSRFPMIIASQNPLYYYTGFPTGLNRYLDSILYLLPINKNRLTVTPLINKRPQRPAQFEINPLNFNTDNRIILLVIYGKSTHGNAWEGAFAKGFGEQKIEPSYLNIYDIYGNKGEIKIVRNKALNVNELGYRTRQ